MSRLVRAVPILAWARSASSLATSAPATSARTTAAAALLPVLLLLLLLLVLLLLLLLLLRRRRRRRRMRMRRLELVMQFWLLLHGPLTSTRESRSRQRKPPHSRRLLLVWPLFQGRHLQPGFLQLRSTACLPVAVACTFSPSRHWCAE